MLNGGEEDTRTVALRTGRNRSRELVKEEWAFLPNEKENQETTL